MSTLTNEEKIYDLLLGENSITLKLLQKENVVSDYETLLEELNNLIEKYKGKDNIPKKLSYTFFAYISNSNSFEFSDKFYSESELETIEDMKDYILEKLIEFYES